MWNFLEKKLKKVENFPIGLRLSGFKQNQSFFFQITCFLVNKAV